MPRTRSAGGQPGARGVGERTTFDPRKKPTSPPRPIGKEGIFLKASSGKQCGTTLTDEAIYPVWLLCHRATSHQGCHLDVENDTWFDYYNGRWIIMPRSRLDGKAKRGRKAPTRKGV